MKKKKLLFGFSFIAIFMLMTMDAWATFALRQGGSTQTVQPIEGATDVVQFYDYYSYSAHTPYVEDQISKIYLYRDSIGNVSLVMHHSIDDSAIALMQENFDLDGVPGGAYVAVSDDPYTTGDEFRLDVSPEGQWGHGYNSDGGVLAGLPMDEPWCITITPEFITGILEWKFETLGGPVNLSMREPIEICFRPTPPPLEPVKWQQRPDMEQGVNIISTPIVDPPSMLTVADDWLCLDGSPVSDLHFWGSYPYWENTQPRPSNAPPGVHRFRVQVYSDAPATTPERFSRPDKLLYEVWVDDFSETYVGSFPVTWPTGAEYEHKYRYDLDLPRIFWQKKDTVYWLNISAIPKMANYPWGWESSMDRWNDIAVQGWYNDPVNWSWSPIFHPATQKRIDMSFELTTCEGPIKWLQFPDMANGINILSLPDNPVVADDWLCTNGKPLTEVRFWGSYFNREGVHWQQGNQGPPEDLLPQSPGVEYFKLSFHKDFPAGVDPEMPWSQPGELIDELRVNFNNVMERYWDSVPHTDIQGRVWWEHKFYYIVRLDRPFEQEEGVVYWLDIGAAPRDPGTGPTWYWGWETSKDHWNDNAVRGLNNGLWWEALGAKTIDFEDLPVSASYNVGDIFTTSGVPISVRPFQWSNGNWTSGGHAIVLNGGNAGGSGNEMNVNNVNLDFVFDVPVNGLTLLFGETGGNLNIEINGDFRNFGNFVDINGSTIGGIDISVVNGLGNDKGTLALTGLIEQFAIGGQELYIDDVKFRQSVDMAFLLITKDDTRHCQGDFDRDGDVDGSDLAIFASDFGRTNCHSSGDCEGDIGYDGDVDGSDLAVFAADFGSTNCPCVLPGH